MQGESSGQTRLSIAEPKSWDACIPIVNKTLWIKSGHADKYNENMFKTLAGDVEMAVKPMNCPCHIQIFNTGLRSWRDLPMRLAEFGKCHRYEPAGTMHGLMRVRGFVQDDAHIFCTEDQIASEVADFCALVKEIYHDFGFDDIVVKFSTRPEKRVGSNEIWDKAEAALAEATKLAGLDYILNPGEGAFYGPKSVQNECRRKMLAFFYDRVQPRTPSASISNSR